MPFLAYTNSLNRNLPTHLKTRCCEEVQRKQNYCRTCLNSWGKSKTINNNYKLFTITFLVFLAVTFFLPIVNEVKSEIIQIPSQLTEAENALKQAFSAVLEADKAKANVSGLLLRLNNGLNLFTQAEIANRLGDISGAAGKLTSVLKIASEVETDAVRARDIALFNSQSAFGSIASISFLAGFYFVLLILLIWRKFKQNYIKRLGNSTPKVKTDEA